MNLLEDGLSSILEGENQELFSKTRGVYDEESQNDTRREN